VVVWIALGVDDFGGGPCPPLYIRGDRVTWKVLVEYSRSLTTTQSGSFLCTAASSMPIRVVTREIRYIHELSLTLEHSMLISSSAAPGLTSSSALDRAWGRSGRHGGASPRGVAGAGAGGGPLQGEAGRGGALRRKGGCGPPLSAASPRRGGVLLSAWPGMGMAQLLRSFHGRQLLVVEDEQRL